MSEPVNRAEQAKALLRLAALAKEGLHNPSGAGATFTGLVGGFPPLPDLTVPTQVALSADEAKAARDPAKLARDARRAEYHTKKRLLREMRELVEQKIPEPDLIRTFQTFQEGMKELGDHIGIGAKLQLYNELFERLNQAIAQGVMHLYFPISLPSPNRTGFYL